jgi:hypothetical protein
MLGVALVVVFSAFATVAYASSDQWFSGNLGSGLGFASTNAHSISYIQGSGNLNGFCVAKDQGLAGYDVASRNVVGTRACASSGGFASRSENSSCCYHGWVDNGTGSGIVIGTSTRYDY